MVVARRVLAFVRRHWLASSISCVVLCGLVCLTVFAWPRLRFNYYVTQLRRTGEGWERDYSEEAYGGPDPVDRHYAGRLAAMHTSRTHHWFVDLLADASENAKVRETAWSAVHYGWGYWRLHEELDTAQLEDWHVLCHRVFCDNSDNMRMRLQVLRSLQHLVERKGELAPKDYDSMRRDWRMMSGETSFNPLIRWEAFELLNAPRAERIAFHLAVLTDDSFSYSVKIRSFVTLNRLGDGMSFGLGKDVLRYRHDGWVPREEAMNEQTARIIAAWFESHPSE